MNIVDYILDLNIPVSRFGKTHSTWILSLALAVHLVASRSQAAVSTGSVCNLPVAMGTPGIRMLPAGRAPTHINVMPSRYWDTVYTLAGMRQTNVALVEVQGNALGPAAPGDDIGSYYLIPKLVRWLGLPVATTFDILYGSLIGLGFLAGALNLTRLFEKWPARAIAVLGMLLLALVAYKIGDVYCFFFVTAAVTVPWMLLLARRPCNNFWVLALFVLLGVLIGIANAVRSQSGTAALLFACGIVVFQLSARKSYKLALLVCLGLGLLAPKLFLGRLIARRDAYLSARCPEYNAHVSRHLLWHAVYAGMGYLQNDYGLRWEDSVCYQKVLSLAPGTEFGSPEYERILKDQVLQLAEHHPWFVFTTLASKAGVVLIVLLFSANFGLIAAFVRHKPLPVELAFWVAIAFNSLFGILVYPLPQYLFGLISFGALYGMTSLGFALEPGCLGNRRRDQVVIAVASSDRNLKVMAVR